MAKDILHEIIGIAIGIGPVDVSFIDEPCSAWYESNVLEDFDALFFHRDVEEDFGGLNADETFLFPLICGWAWGRSIPSSSRHLICSWVNTLGPGGRYWADSGRGSGSDMVYIYMRAKRGTNFEEVERVVYKIGLGDRRTELRG
ncbi:hypothetical protein DTO027B5_7138 [Paecilomyces variotii]|nr:hypothetical protein DTO169C6_7509 [Paecilomyces variotii]KAJ9230542.1 hypothetical protein DTO169E5_8381 [Paecilomyces variotii]KAJ9246606.1 hypothetical protein DTO207G8_8800 [Paecilomyces variotii]KAJ9259722.1 hypothetical protein DTO195F2_4843 [Paecilomyces variotii]KAJ9327228.1 hypothetical protein DTO027B3_1992 [Paecilomyces variotii]